MSKVVTKTGGVTNIAMIGDHLPRRCGIATFTNDLSGALEGELPIGGSVQVVAMDDFPEGYEYPDRVKFQVRQNAQQDYLRAADFININSFELAIMQHEYGIYGGPCGAYILRLMQRLNMPIITTLHTILTDPSDEQATIMKDIGRMSDALVVMSHKASSILKDVYDVDSNKVRYIPHGIPDIPLRASEYFKQQFGLENHKVILTFGLLSPGKGIEYMIDAMPAIAAAHPDVRYLILGATHPHIKRQSGEAYRTSLQQRVYKLGVADNVIFINQFVELDQLCQYLGAADVYATPYLNAAQITSGTLCYAMGAGSATVSTPYWHAEEMLAERRGRLVPFKDPAAFAESINSLLSDPVELSRIRMEVYAYTRPMIWKEVARSYLQLAEEVIEGRSDKPHPHELRQIPRTRLVDELPEINLQHIHVLTDDVGIYQHAIYTTPDRFHGYCTDDNARAMIAMAMYYDQTEDDSVLPLIQRYLSFLHYAFNPENGRFRNFMSFDRRWLEDQGSEDSHCRAMWGLGNLVKHSPNRSIRNLASRVFRDGMPALEKIKAPRAWAFALVALHEYLTVYGGDSTARRMRNLLAGKLHEMYKSNMSADWPWPENELTYANARLCHGLILAGQWIPNSEMYELGVKSLRWLLDLQTAPDGHVSIIGNEVWMSRDGERSHFDQQPIEAMTMVDACVEAYRSNGDRFWLRAARRCFDWFLGRNDLNVPICDFRTGGCHDGLEVHGANQNQGAESTLAWIISLLSMYKILGDEVLVDEKGRPVITKPESEISPDENDDRIHVPKQKVSKLAEVQRESLE